MQRIEQLTRGAFMLALAASGFAVAGEPVHEPRHAPRHAPEPGQHPEGRVPPTQAQQRGAQTSPTRALERPVGREGEAPDITNGETFRSQVQLSALPPEQMALLQTRLQELGLYPGAIDGKFGAGTRSALQRFFQTHAGLASRGIITDTGAGMLGLPPGALDAAINARRAGVDSGPSRGLNGSAEMRSGGDRSSSSPEPGTTSAPQPSGGTNALQRR